MTDKEPKFRRDARKVFDEWASVGKRTVDREIKRVKANRNKKLNFGFKDVNHMTDF